MSKLKIVLRLADDKRSFRPLGPYDREKTDGLKPGADYTVTVSPNRDLDQNRAYRAGLAWAVENIEEIGAVYPTSEHMHKSLLVELGYYSEVPFVILRDEPVTERMRAAGMMALGKTRLTQQDGELVEAIYQAMRREGQHYGVTVVPDSTSFDAMDADTFSLYFDRARILVMQRFNREPWEESGEAAKIKKMDRSLGEAAKRWR